MIFVGQVLTARLQLVASLGQRDELDELPECQHERQQQQQQRELLEWLCAGI